MSRIGKLPIAIPAKVEINIAKDNTITVKGPLGTLTQKVDPDIEVKIEDGVLTVNRPTDQRRHRSFHGLYRSLLANMVKGVSEGFTIKQEFVGVGYRAEVKENNMLEMSLGYSHDIIMMLPKEVSATAVTERRSNPILTLTSCDKQLLGQVAAKIRSLRKPEPYKGKGIKFVGEVLRRKAGKSASAK